MTKLRVAILEDSKELLKSLKEDLEETELVEVVAAAYTSESFLEKVKALNPEAVLLDIDLAGDSMTGLDIAHMVKLPVLFVSGKTKDFYEGIENLNINSNVSIEHITKPITIDKLNKILPKFISEIRALHNQQFVYLDFKNAKRSKVSVNDIVYLCTDKENGADSGNKVMYFTNRKPEVLVDFEFKTMQEKGFNPNQFVTTHKSFRLNIDKYMSYDNKTHEILVTAQSVSGKPEIMRVQVSENYRKVVPSSKK